MTRLEEDSAHDEVQADADGLALPGSPASSGCHPDNESSRIGICVSGGGIRAAAFGLGALQVLQTKGVLARAKYISAVSGGSYIVGALAIMVGRNRPAGSGAVASQTYGKSWDSELPGGNSQAAFAHGSPEERYLRSHLDYLTTGPGGMAGVIGRAVFGFLLNLFFFSLTLWLPFFLLGWIYGLAIPGLRATSSCNSATHCVSGFELTPWYWVPAAVLGGLGIICGLLWVGVSYPTPTRRRRMGAAALVLLVAAVLYIVFGAGFPSLLAWMRGAVSHSVAVPAAGAPTQAAATARSNVTLAVGSSVGLAGLLTTVVSFFRSALNSPSATEKAIEGKLDAFLSTHKQTALNVLAAISVPLFFLISAVLIVNAGAVRPPIGPSAGLRLLFFAIPFAVWFILLAGADVNTWSLHPYYKQHISQAFALQRTDDGLRAQALPEEQPVPISSMNDRVLICATANVREPGVVPTGFNAIPFVFSRQTIGQSSCPLAPASPNLDPIGTKPTAEYDNWDKHNERMTIPMAIALAGAAVSPEMGKMTKAPLTMLFTLANLRLGVWLPNPRRFPGPRPKGWHPLAKIRYRYFYRPRPYYVFLELLRWNRSNARFLYITDGGHYENLGLVELLRRGCTEIWCIDASGDHVDTFNTIGDALAIARAEDIIAGHTLDPHRDMAPEVDAAQDKLRYVQRPYCDGTVIYSERMREDTGSASAHIILVKAGVTNDGPWDIRSYYSRNPGFPADSTLDQLYRSTRFDAYRALGEYSTREAFEAVGQRTLT